MNSPFKDPAPRYAVIINKRSGEGYFEEEEHLESLRAIFADAGATFDLHVVEPDQLDATLDTILQSEAQTVLVGGGDGTVASFADRLAGTQKTMGILPLGTFNLQARATDLPLDPLEAARVLLTAQPEKIDLLRVNGKPSLCAVILGFYPALAKAREEFHGSAWWKKYFRMIYEVLVLMKRTPLLDLTLTSEEGVHHSHTRLAAFSPGSYEDEVGLLPEREDLASGFVSAYIGELIGPVQILQVAARFVTGSLFQPDGMKHLRARSITVTAAGESSLPVMIDGENMILETPLELTLERGTLTILRAPKSDR